MSTSTVTDWISAISGGIAAIGVLLLWSQLVLFKKQVTHDHERSRRERALDLFVQWNQFERTEGHLAIAIAERLNTENARAIWKGEAATLPVTSRGTVERFLSRRGDRCELPVENDVLKLSREDSLALRSGMVECMNLLETIFSAARHHVADPEMITEQFGPLIDPDPTCGKTMMRVIRGVAGGEMSFPSTSEFDRTVMAQKQPSAPGKNALG